MESGFVQLPRFITTREWYSDPIARAVFIDLLLCACWKDEVIRGEQLKRGQLITSLSEVAAKNGIKSSHARSILSRIEKTNDIASRSTSKFRIVTLFCLDCERDNSKADSKRIASPTADEEQSNVILNNNKQVEERTTSAHTREGERLKKGFERFWSAYPKKTAKQQALKAWQKLKPDEELIEKMLLSLERQKRSVQWTKDNGQFIPYPATWLNGRRWEDESEVQNGKNSENCGMPTTETEWLAGFK